MEASAHFRSGDNGVEGNWRDGGRENKDPAGREKRRGNLRALNTGGQRCLGNGGLGGETGTECSQG